MRHILKKAFSRIANIFSHEEKPEIMKLRKMLSDLNPPSSMLQPDGTILTRHGRSIVPMTAHVPDRGGLRINSEYYSQPRIGELMEQLSPLLKSPAGDSVFLDEETGDFSLTSEKGKVLGQIDVFWERRMLSFAKDKVLARKIIERQHGFRPFD